MYWVHYVISSLFPVTIFLGVQIRFFHYKVLTALYLV